MSSREPLDPDAGVLPAAAAERLLERASQLDATREGEVPVAHLRAAAAEAGISRPAFEGALAELRAAGSPRAPDGARASRLRGRRWIAGAAAAALLATGALATSWGRTLSSADAPPAAPTVEEAILLRCLTPGEALELVRPLLQDPASTARSNPTVAPRVVAVRTTPAQMQRVKALLAEHDGAGARNCAAPQNLPPAP